MSQGDPLSVHQWYLENTEQTAGADNGGSAGEDIHLGDVWTSYKGSGIKIGIVDTGIELLHPDLSANIDTALSYNYGTYGTSQDPYDPSPTSNQLASNTIEASHGTACAGITAAVGDNGVGIKGVASEATLAGLNAFSNPESINFADALYAGVFDHNLIDNTSPGYPFSKSDTLDISSNSWNDVPGNLDENAPEYLAIQDGITYGRGGKGIVYCIAAGNFRSTSPEESDNSNWYRELNNPYVMAIAALNAKGRYAGYSNFGANILVSAFGGEYGDTNPAIVTTDLIGSEGMDALNPISYSDNGHLYRQTHFNVTGNESGNYTNRMNGTSAATPMAAGIVALILQANPSLTYRDVRYILATTARKNDPDNSDWVQNGAGHWINHNYGFGAVDVNASVAAAQTHTLLDANITRIYVKDVNLTDINETNPAVIALTVPPGENMTIEFAELSVTNLLGQIEDLEIVLRSPEETNSTLTHTNRILNYYGYNNGFQAFTFGSVRYLDENSSGTWYLYIIDKHANGAGSLLDSITLTLYGRSIQ